MGDTGNVIIDVVDEHPTSTYNTPMPPENRETRRSDKQKASKFNDISILNTTVISIKSDIY